MTACNCGGVKRRKMLSGSKRTGRKTPATPGSQTAGEVIVLTGISRCTRGPARRAARMRRQRIHQEKTIAMKPDVKTEKRAAGRIPAVGSGSGSSNTEAEQG